MDRKMNILARKLMPDGSVTVVEYRTTRQYVTFASWGVTLTISDASGVKTYNIPWTNIELVEELSV